MTSEVSPFMIDMAICDATAAALKIKRSLEVSTGELDSAKMLLESLEGQIARLRENETTSEANNGSDLQRMLGALPDGTSKFGGLPLSLAEEVAPLLKRLVESQLSQDNASHLLTSLARLSEDDAYA